jgi:hypothetical protein
MILVSSHAEISCVVGLCSSESLTGALSTFDQTHESAEPFIDFGFAVCTEAEDFLLCYDLEAVAFCAGKGVRVNCCEDGLEGNYAEGFIFLGSARCK